MITSVIESVQCRTRCAYESDGEDEANVFNVSGSIRKVTKKLSENILKQSDKFLFILFNNDSSL